MRASKHIDLANYFSHSQKPNLHMSKRKENVGSLAEMEQETFDDEGSYPIPPDDIVAYNELRSCADIFRLYTQKVLDIQPEFQRDIAWQPAAQTKFIDSLVKQLPIPSLCFAYDCCIQPLNAIVAWSVSWSKVAFGDLYPSRLRGRSLSSFWT